jgi:hypothetical protein
MSCTRVAVVVLLVAGLAGQAAHTHGPDYTLRAYLNSRFWQPLAKTTREAWPGAARGTRKEGVVFAGMGCSLEGRTRGAHCAYSELEEWMREFPQLIWEDPRQGGTARRLAQARRALDEARAARLSPEEAEELLLVACKVELRAAEMGEARLSDVKAQLRAFLAKARVPRLASEARGWLARVHYLMGERHPAAKIYLRELVDSDSVFDEQSLLLSLRMVFPYNGSSAALADHLEEYFDHPRHALFVVNLVTNPVYADEKELSARQEIGRKVLAALETHESLFAAGADSEALALALMRAALYQGDFERARVFAGRLPAESARRAGPEFHWTAAAAAMLGGREEEAEPHLRAVAESRRAPWQYRDAALQGLVGVYLRLGRAPEAIEAAFRREAWARTATAPVQEERPWSEVLPWIEGHFGRVWLMDLPYLLDFHASDDDLRATLSRLGSRPAQDVVTYALAVRHARREEYREAARLFARVQAWTRESRMREAARLHAAASGSGGSGRARLEARYRYASFLADHSTQVFFDDRLWHGFQRYALMGRACDLCSRAPTDLMDPATRGSVLEQERRVLDAQEERWRAYLLLEALAQEAGPTPLGRRAAVKALEALDGINTERFGRDGDVRAARKRLVAWLG